MPLFVTKTQILFVAALLLLVAPSVLGQSAPMDRAEILGRLAISYSPSYVAYLVRTRGINFSPSPQYIESVKLAGGDGILTDRLDSATSVASTNDQNDLVHLAKCAEFLHSGDVDSADLECRASIDDSPQSAWPLVATARVLSLDFLSRIPIEAAKQKTAERIALLEKASSLGPDLAVLQRTTGTTHGVSEPSPEEQRSRALDAQEVETANDRDPYGFRLADQLNGSNEEVSDSQSRPSEQIVVRPETLRFAQDYPDLASAHMMLAVEYARARCFDQAQSEMGEALRLEPGNSAIHSALAAVLLSRHKSDDAIE